MGALNVLIADADNTFAMNLRRELLDQGLKCNIQVTDNMERALSYITDEEIDVLIADLYVPGGDGLSLIHRLKQVNHDAVVVLCSALLRGGIVKHSTPSDIDLTVSKPCFASSLCEELSTLVDGDNDGDATDIEPGIDAAVVQMIRELGIPPHVKGYRYLKEAVKMAIVAPYCMDGITKTIYPEIGKKYQTSVANIERAIRYAISDAWKHRRNQRWERYLSLDLQERKKRPSNSELISALVEYYHLHMKSLDKAE